MKKSIFLIAICYFALETSCQTFSSDPVDVKDLKCAVCKTTISEFQKLVESVDKSRKVDVGNSRLDADGNYIKKTVPMFQSEIFVSEMLEKVCENMENFARGRDKKSKKIVVMNLFDQSKNLNSRINEVDLITDMDMNKSLKYYCERLVEEYEDTIYDFVKKQEENLVNEICVKAIHLCPVEKEPVKDEQVEDEQVKDEL